MRYVVVSHPFAAGGDMKSNAWEVLQLSSTGELARPGRTFMMGRATVGEVAFTLDGQIGVAAQEDGSVGVFSLDAAGAPTVIHAALKGAFYAHKVVTAPDGTIYVLDDQWRENGGGIYRLAIDCANNVTDGGLVAASKLPAGLAFRADGSALLAANDIATSPAGAEGHMLAWNGGAPSLTTSTDLFPEDEAIIGGTALGFANGSHFFVGDTSGFSSVPNAVAIAPVTGSTFGTVERIEVEDPITILADPDHDQVVALSGFGNAMFVLDKPSTTWRKREPTYVGTRPQLPGGGVLITAGALRGHMLVAENSGVRQARFTATGVEDLGLFLLGDDLASSTGAIGVTP